MASATFESVRVVRSAIAAKRRRSRLRGVTGASGEPCAQRRSERPQREEPLRPGAFVRGIGVSVLIASGYVAVVSGLRWLLAA